MKIVQLIRCPHNGPPSYAIDQFFKDEDCTIRHRFDGPAIIWSNGEVDYYINGNFCNHDAYCNWLKEMKIDLNDLSEHDKSIIMMTWGFENG